MYDENGTYDRELQGRALRLIIERCPNLAAEAAAAMRSGSDAARQMRVDRLVPAALQRAGAWGEEDRQVLAAAMSEPGTGGSD
jgi:hypothetical protein